MTGHAVAVIDHVHVIIVDRDRRTVTHSKTQLVTPEAVTLLSVHHHPTDSVVELVVDLDVDLDVADATGVLAKII